MGESPTHPTPLTMCISHFKVHHLTFFPLLPVYYGHMRSQPNINIIKLHYKLLAWTTYGYVRGKGSECKSI